LALHRSLHPDWNPQPYWWEEAPPMPADAQLPAQADVAIVGAGYCGLHAARTLAAAGLQVVVIEAKNPGFGASTRNHGMLSGGLKVPANLSTRLGEPWAEQFRRTAFESFGYITNLILDHDLDVDYNPSGRFIGAHSPKAYAALEARRNFLMNSYGYHVRMVPRSEQRAEVGSDFYYGGYVIDEVSGMHPAKLHREVRRLAEAAGATICGNAEVTSISRDVGRYLVRTARGSIRADRVFVATNAYTGAFNGTMFPFIKRRIVPVTAYMVATEELPLDLTERILPTNRMCGDTKRSLYAFRLSPDKRRIIFAGRAKFRDISEKDATPILHRFMCDVWPELSPYRLTHCWKGLVAFTFDAVPHLGVHDGILYAAGCQGNGVAIMSYLGHQAALKMLNGSERQCGHDGIPFPTRPTYTGNPWFLPAVGAYYKARDRIDRYFAS
jgi:glycine/D-amino acid oxidase-like deaminating enzyme